MKKTVLSIVITLCSVFMNGQISAFAQTARPQKSPVTKPDSAAPFANADVVKLSKLGLGDEVVIAKINQAKTVDFKLETDDLAKLLDQGVSKGVIAAMLKRATPQAASVPQKEPTAVTGPGTMDPRAWQVASTIRILTSAGETPLKTSHIELKMAGFFMAKHVNFVAPGTQSRTRSSDKSLCVLITTEFPPEGYFYLIRLKIDAKDNNRTLVMATLKPAPDEDFVVACTVKQDSDKEWRLVPKAPLEPGEYCIWTKAPSQGPAGMYDFGVDK